MTEGTTYTVVMVRHGESEANLLDLYTGWDDVHLTDEGNKDQ
jgi:bisphosphoglycerate-dependent phosphoglycerate mutase